MAHSRKRPVCRDSLTRSRRRVGRQFIRRLAAETLERRILLAAVIAEEPLAASHNAPTSTDVSATFDEALTTASNESFSVKSRQAGIAEGTITISSATVTLQPNSVFFPGDLVEVAATAAIQGVAAGVPRVWQFRTATAPNGTAEFVDSGQNLGTTAARDIEFGDLDGDGDLDAVESGEYSISTWMNDGFGVFSNGQLIAGNNQETELGDVDSDGDLDIVSTNNVFFNDGSGNFSDSGQGIGGFLRSIGMGDIDGDGDLDVLRGVPYGGDRVWFNNGSGIFSNSGQTLGFATSDSIQLGDLDSDGDLDAFTVYYGADNRVWVNDGSGVFTDSGQLIGGFSASKDVDLGDLDGDGDLDAMVVNRDQGNRVWFNRPGNALLAITAADASRLEGDSGETPFTFEVRRTGDLSAASSVNFGVLGSGNQATDADDFGGTFPSGVVEFAAGESLAVITVLAAGDTLLEEDEQFTVTLFGPTPATTQIVSSAAIGTIEDDDAESLGVIAIVPTSSGFSAEFSIAFDAALLNLYDTATADRGAPDVVLVGAASGTIAGSLVIDSSAKRVSFIKSGGPLPPDTFTIPSAVPPTASNRRRAICC